ncbi:IQ domain-containing protein E isoform X4 [Mauremys reevesii]|uniref:IQ domain-containing protein E isoform X4 n=1 Tax=Mauremys reevesii TaxID=260615 RepID=UPI00193F1FC2|nr:IQ domain-containing protein E isoform X4 [Mauremys reevesii]
MDVMTVSCTEGDDSLSAVTYESDTEMKRKKKTSHKPPKSPKSPYISSTYLHPKKAAVWRSLKGTGIIHHENPMARTPRQMWLGSLKQAGMSQALKSDFDVAHARTNLSSSTPEYLKEALGMKKPKHARSSSNGYIPGTPDYKEKEDMYDEIIELKKTIQVQKSEGDRMKTKIRRLEEENNRKDRQIEQLLDPSRGSDFAQTLAEKNDTRWVINGLKQKILKLEQQCKEKDNTINKFQTDVKTTNLEEMRIAMETYYEEVHLIRRLQTLLAKSEAVGKKSLPESRESQKRLKVLNAAVLRLSKNIKELQDENKSLKADLDRVLSSSPASTKTKNYNEWSRQRLVRRISELEKEVHEMENNRLQSSANGTSPLLALPPSASVQLDQPDTQEPDPLEECERLQGLVKKLKGDRSALQNQLASKYEVKESTGERSTVDLAGFTRPAKTTADASIATTLILRSEVKQLQQAKTELERELQKLQEMEKEKSEKEETLREEIQSLTHKVRELEAELHEDKRQTADDTMETPNKPSFACFHQGKEDNRKEQAAKLIQSQWKAYRNKKEEIALDQAAVVIQAAFRGHLARQKLLLNNTLRRKSPAMHSLGNKGPNMSHGSSPLSLSSDFKEDEEVVTFIQSVFRAHLARKGEHEERSSVSRASSERTFPAVSNRKKKQISSALRKPLSSAFTSTSPDDEDSEVTSEEVVEELTAEGGERRSRDHKLSSLQPSSVLSSQDQLQPIFSPPLDEAHSDDSDDNVVSPSLLVKKNYSHF